MSSNPNYLEIKNLKVVYEGERQNALKAIDGIDLELCKGQIASVVGPSGCGKSTLLKVLSGIIDNYEGQVSLQGQPIDAKKNRIGFIPQNYGLINWKTVKENILLSSKIKDGRKNIDWALYDTLLRKLDITDLENKYPAYLSGGQQQRVSIARALLLKPNILLMDEPFSALDVMTRQEAQEVFLSIWREHKVTTIIVTHDIEEATRLGQKIIVLSQGPGRILDIIDHSNKGAVAAIKGAMNYAIQEI